MVDKAQILAWIRMYAAEIAANKTYLTDLDAAIGDADHGINMDRGFGEVLGKLPALEGQDVGAILKGAGMTLLSKVGGASGPLYGTLFMRMGLSSAGKENLTDDEFVAGLASGVEGIQQRGSARRGEKTMVDALAPAVEALRSQLALGAPLCPALKAAANAAQTGMEATVAMQATKGRASYLGPRSIGHQDPGATSAYLLLKTAAQAFCGEQEHERNDA